MPLKKGDLVNLAGGQYKITDVLSRGRIRMKQVGKAAESKFGRLKLKKAKVKAPDPQERP